MNGAASGDLRWGRGTYAALSTAYGAFVVYGSLVPLRFQFVPLGHAVRRFIDVLSGPLQIDSRTDLAVNFLLFVPLGYLLSAALATDRPGAPRWLAAGAVAAFGVMLTAGVEFTQIYFPGRTVALSDMVAETIGGGAGVLLWLIAGDVVTAWLRAFAGERERPAIVQRLLVGYCVVFFASQLMPLDVTANLGELAGKYRRGMILLRPFAYAHESAFAAVWDHVGDVLLSVPIGMAGVLAWTEREARRSALVAFGLAAIFVVAVEVCQLFVLSRYADVTDIIVGGAGAGIGVGLASVLSGRSVLGRARSQPQGVVRAARLAVPAWVLFLASYHWSPYDFSLSPDQVTEGMKRLLRIPFLSYFLGTEFNAFTEMARKTVLALPLGVLLGLSWPLPPGGSPGYSLRRPLLLGAAFATLCGIELGQVFLRSRFPDITDAFIGAAGVIVGLWMADRI
jgi:glycopeptide antibiotics resistance protein